MLTINELILAKVETVKGDDSLPVVGSDAILASGLAWKLEGLNMISREAEMGSGLAADRQPIYGDALKTITFDVKVKGSGTAGTPPEIDPLLRMCAMQVTNVPATSDTYAPVSDFDTQETGTLYFPMDGLRHILTGCVGTFTVNFETNNVIAFSFTFTGHSSKPTDVPFAAGTFDATVPPVIQAAAFTVGGYAAVINALSFDYGAAISMPKDMNAADGYGVLGIGKFSAKGSFDPLMVTAATNDFMGDLEDGTSMALTTGVIGSTAGNRVQISMPAIAYVDMSPGSREIHRTYEVPYMAADSAGDDFVSIAFT